MRMVQEPEDRIIQVGVPGGAGRQFSHPGTGAPRQRLYRQAPQWV
jgi:hypothetical protein